MDTIELTIDELRVLYDDRVRDLEYEYNRAEAAEASVKQLRAVCENVAYNLEVSGNEWTGWHSKIVLVYLRSVLDNTQDTL